MIRVFVCTGWLQVHTSWEGPSCQHGASPGGHGWATHPSWALSSSAGHQGPVSTPW